MRRPVWRSRCPGLVVVLVAAACGSDPSVPPEVRLEPGGRSLLVQPDLCDYEVTLEEAHDAVTLTIHRGAPGSDCNRNEVVPLSRPLGERPVIDGRTGDVIPLMEWD